MLVGFLWQSHNSLKVCRRQLDRGGERDRFQIVTFLKIWTSYIASQKNMAEPSAGTASLLCPQGCWDWPKIAAGVPGAAQRTRSVCTELQKRGAFLPRWGSKGLLGEKKVFNQKTACSYSSHCKTKLFVRNCTFWRAHYCKGRKEVVDIVPRREEADVGDWRTKSKMEGKTSIQLKKFTHLCKITCAYL